MLMEASLDSTRLLRDESRGELESGSQSENGVVSADLATENASPDDQLTEGKVDTDGCLHEFEYDINCPAWFRHSFPGEDYNEMQAVEAKRGDVRCEECAIRCAILACADCDLTHVCFTCMDAIHITCNLAHHQINLISNDTGPSVKQILKQTEIESEHIVQPRIYHPSSCPASPTKSGTVKLLPGDNIFFRHSECTRWKRELLHGIVLSSTPEAGTETTCVVPKTYHRVVWIRGIEALENGFYKANLVPPDLAPGQTSFWPIPIGEFPTRLAAWRAVLSAERIARHKLRREVLGKRFSVDTFPTDETIDEIITETWHELENELQVRRQDILFGISKQYDLKFITEIVNGTWNFKAWMDFIGRKRYLLEDEVCKLDCQSNKTGSSRFTSIYWNPDARIRFFRLEERDILLPRTVRNAHLTTIVTQMLFLYLGHSWRQWQVFVKWKRLEEVRLRQYEAASKLQRWIQRVNERRRESLNALAALAHAADGIDLYIRRQEQAVKLYDFMLAQYQAKMRHAMQLWSVAAEIDSPEVQRRLKVMEQINWHPSHGHTALPKLPNMHSRQLKNGLIRIENAKLYRQFQVAHVGPTDRSYWIIRGRVLAGSYPWASINNCKAGSKHDVAAQILLDGVGTFVCLMLDDELSELERSLSLPLEIRRALKTMGTFTTPWTFEKLVRASYNSVKTDITNAIRIVTRHLDTAEKDLNSASNPQEHIECSNSIILLRQQLEKNNQMLQNLPMLKFITLPIPKQTAIDDEVVKEHVKHLEDRLRVGENLYIFSSNGHNRTGLIGSLLLGRLYGLTSRDALERAQRLHDCQISMQSVPQTRRTSSPGAAHHIATVRRILAEAEAVYAPIQLVNQGGGLEWWRAQRRAVVAEPYLRKDGFMISDKPDAQGQECQRNEHFNLTRVAKRESYAVKLKKICARQQAMEAEESLSLGIQYPVVTPRDRRELRQCVRSVAGHLVEMVVLRINLHKELCAHQSSCRNEANDITIKTIFQATKGRKP